MSDIVGMMISEITTRSPFKDLFMINEMVLNAIEDDMRKYGFDESAPIVLLKKGNVVVDGHTRLQAAKNAGLKEVDVCMADFDEQTAVEYAIHNQRDRRNITDAEILKCVEAIDKRRQVGRHKTEYVFKVKNNIEGIDSIEDRQKPSHEQTARELRITPSKVSQVRTILDSKNDKIKQEVLKGNKSIHVASEEIKQTKLKARPAAAQVNIAYRKFKKTMKMIVDDAILNGIEVSQIKQVVKDLLKSKEVSPCV